MKQRGDQTKLLPSQPTWQGEGVLWIDCPSISAQPRRCMELSKDRISIGSGSHNDIVLADPHVSTAHAEIIKTSQGYELHDLQSRNGTRVQGVLITSALLKAGAAIEIGQTRLVLQPKTSTASSQSHDEAGPAYFFGDLAASAPAMQPVFDALARFAPTDLTILLFGETGVGKDILAQAIHRQSTRASQPFVVFDCGAAVSTLIESHLFGHDRGAFTGAVAEHAGAFERANGGTLFLDEIGELALELQPKLLRVLESKNVVRVGGQSERRVDVRVIAATNRDLKAEVDAGRFRQDLFFRLGGMSLPIPALRERKEDIPSIAEAFCRKAGRPGISKEAMSVLLRHDWPGNVRELRNVVERAIAMADGNVVRTKDLMLFDSKESRASKIGTGAFGVNDDGQGSGTGKMTSLAGKTLEQIESLALQETLQEVEGNRSRAAKLLGIAPSTLYAKMKKYGLD